MKIDTSLNPVNFKDGDETRQFASYNAKLQDILRNIVNNLSNLKIVTSAPTDKELDELLNRSDAVILHHATQGSRCVYYKYQGTVYKIQSA